MVSELFHCRLLYGSKSIDELVNSNITILLERFLYMRPEIICNSYISFIRSLHNDVVPCRILNPRHPVLKSRLAVFCSRNPSWH